LSGKGASARAFDQYATWYDAFNEGKDYTAEAEYILHKVRAWQPAPKRWLDVGCGTGNHLAHLHSLGIQVEGVDASPSMVAQARAAHLQIPFRVASAQEFRLDGKRDVISMLFHVLSYQTTDRAVARTLENVAAHLAPRGIYVFDFWHTEGVLLDPPGPRVREARVGERRLFRIARPTEDRARHLIDVHYDFCWDSPEGPVVHEEDHAMRHFTAGELQAFLARSGLAVVTCEGWMHQRALRPTDWYGLVCARRQSDRP
jgi:SAM-dependent methyltransferase